MKRTGKLGHIEYAVVGRGPYLFLVGAPAGIAGFDSLASALGDRFSVVLHDPRGIGGSCMPDEAVVTPDVLADDLARLVRHLCGEPALFMGASGGAVTMLALLDQSPELVERAVLHEPPLFALLPDAESVLARADLAFQAARSDPQEGCQQFSDLTELLQSTIVEHPRPDSIRLPPLSDAELNKQRFALGVMAAPTVHYLPSAAVANSGRVIVSAGSESIGQVARRAARALADRLQLPFLDAPGNHLAPTTRADEFGNWLAPLLRGRAPEVID